jgi:hypothetical protein
MPVVGFDNGHFLFYFCGKIFYIWAFFVFLEEKSAFTGDSTHKQGIGRRAFLLNLTILLHGYKRSIIE